jgi:hypothetical protein
MKLSGRRPTCTRRSQLKERMTRMMKRRIVMMTWKPDEKMLSQSKLRLMIPLGLVVEADDVEEVVVNEVVELIVGEIEKKEEEEVGEEAEENAPNVGAVSEAVARKLPLTLRMKMTSQVSSSHPHRRMLGYTIKGLEPNEMTASLLTEYPTRIFPALV